MSLVKRHSAQTTWYLPGIFLGMKFTFKRMIQNLFNQDKMITLNYPEEKYEYSPRFKGSHVLTVNSQGKVRCTACMLCATACPAQCISIVASEDNDKSVEKYPLSYEIDTLRCVYCGMCEEACPVDAVRMGPEWQTPGLNGTPFVQGIEHLAYRPTLNGGKGVRSIVDDGERHKAGI